MGVVLYVVAFMLALSNAEVVVYSIGGRTSNMFSAQVYNVLVQLLGGDQRIVVYNKETLVLINDHGTKSTLKAYPSNSTIRDPPFFSFSFSRRRKEPPLPSPIFFSPYFPMCFLRIILIYLRVVCHCH